MEEERIKVVVRVRPARAAAAAGSADGGAGAGASGKAKKKKRGKARKGEGKKASPQAAAKAGAGPSQRAPTKSARGAAGGKGAAGTKGGAAAPATAGSGRGARGGGSSSSSRTRPVSLTRGGQAVGVAGGVAKKKPKKAAASDAAAGPKRGAAKAKRNGASSAPGVDPSAAWAYDEQQIADATDTSRCYTFDRVYGPDSQSTAIYTDHIRPLVQDAVAGTNATVFAYGQTGSGKTHTMLGSSAQPGLLRLAAAELFALIDAQPERQFVVTVAYMEIYNERVNDLMAKSGTDLRIFEDATEGVIVDAITTQPVHSEDALLAFVRRGEKARHYRATAANNRSSRSHTLFRVRVLSTDADGAVTVAVLNLIDLAGSECLGDTATGGAGQKEGAAINKSLLALARIMEALCKRKTGHLPFRDSKLTRILEPSLVGNSRIAIVCTLNPELAKLAESHNTLHFASNAKDVRKQVVKRNRIPAAGGDAALLARYNDQMRLLQKLLAENEAYKAEIGRLRSLLDAQKAGVAAATPAAAAAAAAVAPGAPSAPGAGKPVTLAASAPAAARAPAAAELEEQRALAAQDTAIAKAQAEGLTDYERVEMRRMAYEIWKLRRALAEREGRAVTPFPGGAPERRSIGASGAGGSIASAATRAASVRMAPTRADDSGSGYDEYEYYDSADGDGAWDDGDDGVVSAGDDGDDDGDAVDGDDEYEYYDDEDGGDAASDGLGEEDEYDDDDDDGDDDDDDDGDDDDDDDDDE